jgi:hypothetical protein
MFFTLYTLVQHIEIFSDAAKNVHVFSINRKLYEVSRIKVTARINFTK